VGKDGDPFGWIQHVYIAPSTNASLSAPNWFRLLCGAGIIGRIWSACLQHEVQYKE